MIIKPLGFQAFKQSNWSHIDIKTYMGTKTTQALVFLLINIQFYFSDVSLHVFKIWADVPTDKVWRLDGFETDMLASWNYYDIEPTASQS